MPMRQLQWWSILALLLMSFPLSMNAQDCEGASNAQFLHGNNIRALINNSGSLFMDQNGDARFQVPFTSATAPSTIFASGLWMGGFAPTGTLHLSAQLYGYSSSTKKYDYLPGPLDENGNLPDDCLVWDKVWSVSAPLIQQHLEDYADNNMIDQPLAAIFAWPGAGNPHFEDYNGFALPSGEDFAPFMDNNLDGVYDPMDGDYPNVHQSTVPPQQITWTVFNDLGIEETGGEPLKVEIQLTSWALGCSNNEQLNHTIFNSYKFINKSGVQYDSLQIGMWTDFDLGCFTDDYLGSAPALNTYFTYNEDNDDSTCFSNIAPYGVNPPVQAITVLNADLSHFIYYYNRNVNNGQPFETTDPETVPEYFNYLNGLWRDGTPVTEGGIGYDPGGNSPVTDFAFAADPNDPTGWSHFTTGLAPLDTRAVGSVNFGSFLPGQIQTLDLAYSYFRVEGSDHLGNVTEMYAGVAALQNWYENDFSDICALPISCEEDCVWPGDANADGIANHCDLLTIGLKNDVVGPTRPGLLLWRPVDSDDWTDTSIDDTNAKHADCNGDGAVTKDDFGVTLFNYGETTPDYTPSTDIYSEGPELFVSSLPPDAFETIEAGDEFFYQIHIGSVPDLYGVAFSLEYDTRYIVSLDNSLSEFQNGTTSIKVIKHDPGRGVLEYAQIGLDGETLIENGTLMYALLRTQPAFLDPLPSDTTYLRFKNVKGVRADGSTIELGGVTQVMVFPDIMVSTDGQIVKSPLVRVFPNPTQGLVTIQSRNEAIEAVQVYTLAGQRVYQQIGLSSTQLDVPLGHLPKGLYLVKVFADEQWSVRKIVVE